MYQTLHLTISSLGPEHGLTHPLGYMSSSQSNAATLNIQIRISITFIIETVNVVFDTNNLCSYGTFGELANDDDFFYLGLVRIL